MGRKKKKSIKPWCWYCNREFDDDKVLIYHQKAKHFKCHICHKKLYTAPGLAIHCSQVHKETVSKVPNAVAGRDNIDLEIFGMEGIPEGDRIAHELAVQGVARPSLDGEPSPKMPRIDGPVMYTPPVIPGMGPPVIMPGMAAPVLPGMTPPGAMGMPAGVKPGMPPPGMHVPPPSRPLFPSAGLPSPNVPAATPPVNSNIPRPTFPAYQGQPGPSSAPPPVATLPDLPPRVVAKVLPVGANSKLIHPEDDISMEEIRSQLPKYRTAKLSSRPAAAMAGPPTFQLPMQGNIPPPARPQMSAPPMIRPGMGPPPPLNPNMGGPPRPNIVHPGMGPPPPAMPMMPPQHPPQIR